jgi:hypothetical protein
LAGVAGRRWELPGIAAIIDVGRITTPARCIEAQALMRYALPFLTLLTAVPALAQIDLAVELDLDGTIGNGPDTVYIDPGDSVLVDVWVVEVGGPWYTWWNFFGIYIVDNGLLDSLKAEMVLPPNWDGISYEHGDTLYVFAVDLAFLSDPSPPTRVYALAYGAFQGSGAAFLDVDLDRSFWGPFEFYPFVGYVGAVVVIGEPTRAEQSSWGAVKRLFR